MKNVEALKEVEARVERLNGLVPILYAQERCAAGGPLHILIDDGNVRDSDVVFCYARCHDEDWRHCRSVALAILHELMFFTPAQRLMWLEKELTEDILSGKDFILVHEKAVGSASRTLAIPREMFDPLTHEEWW